MLTLTLPVHVWDDGDVIAYLDGMFTATWEGAELLLGDVNTDQIVDERDKIEAFMPVIDEAVGGGLATLEKVEIRFYRSGKPAEREGEE